MSDGIIVIVFVVGLFVLAFLFWFLRELVLWYFKINDVITLLKSIDSHLEKLDKSPAANGLPQKPPVDHLRVSSSLR